MARSADTANEPTLQSQKTRISIGRDRGVLPSLHLANFTRVGGAWSSGGVGPLFAATCRHRVLAGPMDPAGPATAGRGFPLSCDVSKNAKGDAGSVPAGLSREKRGRKASILEIVNQDRFPAHSLSGQGVIYSNKGNNSACGKKSLKATGQRKKAPGQGEQPASSSRLAVSPTHYPSSTRTRNPAPCRGVSTPIPEVPLSQPALLRGIGGTEQMPCCHPHLRGLRQG